VLTIDVESRSDVMNDYYDANKESKVEPTFTDTSALEFVPMTTIPRLHSRELSVMCKETLKQPQVQVHRWRLVMARNKGLSLIVQRQKEMTDLMIMQQNHSLLPKREVPVFDGNPLSYQSFIHAFKFLIEDKTSNSQDRLYFLEQFTTGQARALVHSCLHMEACRGYTEAQQLLKKHFRNEMKIANAYIEKALNWTTIKVDDGKSLHAFALYLRECCNVIQNLQYMDELDVVSNLKLIVSKLPYKLRERWRTVTFESFQRTNTRIGFRNLVEFLETQAEILLHPVFGDIKDPSPVKGTVLKPRTISLTTAKRGSNFVTTVTRPDEQTCKEASKEQLQATTHAAILTSCCYCQGKHALNDCIKLKSVSQDKKVEYLKRNGHCFGCLKKGHMSKDCNKKMVCQICQRKHPTLLHIDNSKNQILPKMNFSEPKEEMLVNSALVSADHATGASK